MVAEDGRTDLLYNEKRGLYSEMGIQSFRASPRNAFGVSTNGGGTVSIDLRGVGHQNYGRTKQCTCGPSWEAFVSNLEFKPWEAFIQPPPSATSSAHQAVRYLASGPISDHRGVSTDREEVTFGIAHGQDCHPRSRRPSSAAYPFPLRGTSWSNLLS